MFNDLYAQLTSHKDDYEEHIGSNESDKDHIFNKFQIIQKEYLNALETFKIEVSQQVEAIKTHFLVPPDTILQNNKAALNKMERAIHTSECAIKKAESAETRSLISEKKLKNFELTFRSKTNQV